MVFRNCSGCKNGEVGGQVLRCGSLYAPHLSGLQVVHVRMHQVPDVLRQTVLLTVRDDNAFTGETTIVCAVKQGTACIGLHAYRLDIDAVHVGGELCDCHTSRWWDEALRDSGQYKACLLREVQPELIINLPSGWESTSSRDDGRHELAAVIKYRGSAGDCGIRRFQGGIATCQQPGRARAWVPCVDLHDKFNCWNLVFQVPKGLIVVAPGDLKSSPGGTEAASQPGRWEYDIPNPVPARSVVIAIGNFSLFVDERPPAVLSGAAEFLIPAEDVAGHGGDGGAATGAVGDCPGVTCFVPANTPAAGELGSTCDALALIQSFLEHRLQCRVPWPLYSQVFLPEAVCQGPGRHFGPGVTVVSQAVMCAEKSLEQRMASRIALAGALAEQWFGGLLVAATAADRWLEWGLQGYLQMLFIRTAYGSNEARYARIKHRDAVVAADNGLMPPLSWRAAPHSPEDVYLLTESLHYSHALRLKATAIVLALESKCGSDAFLPIVRSLVRAALAARLLPVPLQAPSAQDAAQPPAAPAAAAAAAAPPVPWVLTSAAFLKQVSQVGGFRREIGSFAERWIYGTGCPHILAAFSLKPAGENVLEVALQQTGSIAAKRSADRALAADRQHAGVIRVTVRELETTNEHAIFLGGEGLAIHSLRLTMKVNQRRNKRRADAIDDSELNGSNILHCLVDPHSEWLASTTVLQSEAMLKMQLLHMRDVDAQHAAVKALARLVADVREGKERQVTKVSKHTETRAKASEKGEKWDRLDAHTVPGGLGDVHTILVMLLKDPNYYYRVRMDAAEALGRMAALVIPDPRNVNHAYPPLALSALLAFYREAACDPATGAHLPLDFRDLAAYHVRLAVLAALARARNAAARSPEDAQGMLLRAIEQAESRSAKYGSVGFRVAVLESLAYVAPATPRELARVLAALQSSVMRDAAMPSHGNVISVAALGAAARLAAAFPAARTTISTQLAIVSECATLSPQVRVAAAQARVHLCDPTLDAILSAAMNSKAPVDTMPSTRDGGAVMRDDAALLEGEASEAVDPMKCKDIHSGEGSFCCQAQAAALSAAAHRLSALHAAHIVAVGRKRSATAAGLQLTEDGGPPEVAVAALSPMLSMHAVPALRHEAFKALNASAGQEPSLMHLVTAANSDATTHGGKPTTSAAATAATGGDTGTKPKRKKLVLKKLTHDAATSHPSAPSPTATVATGATWVTGAAGEAEACDADGGGPSSGAPVGGAGSSGEGTAAQPQSQLDSKSQEEQGGGAATGGTGDGADAAEGAQEVPPASVATASASMHATPASKFTGAAASSGAPSSPRVTGTACGPAADGATEEVATGIVAGAGTASGPTTAADVAGAIGGGAQDQGAGEPSKKADKKDGEGSAKKKEKKEKKPKDKDKEKSKKEKKEKKDKDKDKSHKKEKKEKKEKKDKDKKASEKPS